MSNQLKIWGIGGYFSQVFRSTINDGVPFYPLWFNQFLNRKLPVIIDTNNLMLVYASVPILRAIIDRKAELLQNGRLKVVDINDEEKEFPDDPVYQLLYRPNPLQKKTDFLAQWSVMRDVYAMSIIYKNKASSKSFPKTLWVFPTGEMKVIPTGYLFDQTKIENIIEKFQHINTQAPSAAPKDYSPGEIMFYVDGQSDRYFFGISKIVTNKLLVSNLQQALTTRNVLLTDMGARGILSNKTPDATPLGKNEREKIEKDYRKQYGNGEDQQKIIITNSALEFQPMSFPTKDLLAFEEVEDCFCHLVEAYGLIREIFPSSETGKSSNTIGADGKGKTEEALKICYETTIQQTADEFCRGFNDDPDFGLADRRRKLICTYDHLPVMKEDQVSAEQVENTRKAGAATQTASLLALNAAVVSGQIEYAAALEIAINVQGLEDKIAKKIILEPKEIIDPSIDMNDEQKQLIKKYLTQ